MPPRTVSRIAFLVLLCPGLAVSMADRAGAVQGAPGFEFDKQIGAPAPPGPAPVMTRTVHGEMTGDLRPDVVLLEGDRPQWVIGPGLYEAVIDLPETATDIAALPAGAPSGRDAVLLVTASGLRRYWIDAVQAASVGDSVGTGAWSGASLVRTGGDLGQGGSAVLGIDSTRESLLLLADPDQPSTESLVDYSDTWTLYDASFIEWDGSPGSEVVLLTSGGLKIIEPYGGLLYSAPQGDDSDRLALVDQVGLATQRLAPAVEQANGMSYLYCFDPTRVDAPLFLGDIDIVALVTGDSDADGRDEMLVSQRTTGELIWFRNQAGTAPGGDAFNWTPTTSLMIDLTSDGTGWQAAPENHATPVFTDLDSDGDADILFPVQKESALTLARGRTIDHRKRCPTPTGFLLYHDGNQGELYVRLAPPAQPSPQDEAIEVVVWRQADHDASLEPEAVHYALVSTAQWPGVIEIPWDESLASEALFDIQLRMVELDDATPPALVSAGPSTVWGASTDSGSVSGIAEDYSVDPQSILWFVVIPEPGSGPPDPEDPRWQEEGGAGSVPLPCVPCFDEDFPDDKSGM